MMALHEKPELTTLDAVRSLAAKLDQLSHGERSKTVNAFACLYGWSMNKVYRELKKVGWSSGRKRRTDAGTTSVSENDLTVLSATLRAGIRKNGKATMETPNAKSMLMENGIGLNVSAGRLNTLLRQRAMDTRSQKAAAPYQSMRSLHPNHVHQVDPSLCLLFYMPDGTQRIIRDDEAYKNKPEFIEKVGEMKIWRYVMTDHYSGSVTVRYYQSKGETQANLYDFLLYCWQKKEELPFHGVPKMMVWDKGSANTSSAIKIALKALQVETYEHQAGNPRAKGGVENANNLVEKLFESRLKFEPVENVEQLNTAVIAWTAAYNANAIPHYDSRLKRRGMAKPVGRYALWQTIRKEHLRILPDVEVCRYLLSSEPKPRKVQADMSISFKHPSSKKSETYSLIGLDLVRPRMTVKVSPLVYGNALVMISVEDYKGDIVEHIVEPIEIADPLAGFRADAAIFGEGFKSLPDTVASSASKASDKVAYPDKTEKEIKKAKQNNAAPFGGLNAHSHLKDVYIPETMARPGTDLSVPDRVSVEVKPLSHLQTAKRLRARMGSDWQGSHFEQIKTLYPDGVAEHELDHLVEQLTQQPSHGLRAVK